MIINRLIQAVGVAAVVFAIWEFAGIYHARQVASVYIPSCQQQIEPGKLAAQGVGDDDITAQLRQCVTGRFTFWDNLLLNADAFQLQYSKEPLPAQPQ
ncbi:hypothetical protein QCD60_02925 [Pokkaliibacter sp. MBI-7]|uniref:hypothetical protein n=1 Tax=Pokkaliibacter sp. MBI-7 TaxID=3040600 RepID=UPI002446A3E8|nr:hypothetical protein [Pokkaliibacter sp. MBI-7]MDH2431512.1 hypothetical protein [Pokkaliibacter sp. MBI-7]